MALQKRKGRLIVLLKMIGVFLIGLSFLGILSCNSGTSSTTSSAGSSGTGTSWTIAIQIGTNPLRLGSTTSILAQVKDRTGAPAPKGTNICTTVVRNGLLKPGAVDVFATICETTTNDIGQTIQTYTAITNDKFTASTGDDTIEVSSQGTIARATITVN